MKHRFFALSVLALSLSLTSCLDETPKDQIPETEIYDSANSLYVNAVASLYNYIGAHEEGEGLQGTCRGIYDYNTLTTDEAIIPIRGGNWYDGGLWENMYDHTWTATDTDLYNVWKYLYKVIVLSTKSLETIEKHKALLTEQQRVDYAAEVRAVRAMYYYYAMDMFGRIPILQSSTQKTADIRQSNRSDVFWYVVKELQDVAPLLANEHSNLQGNYYGRVTRPVAWFLLAKLSLNAEVYTDDDGPTLHVLTARPLCSTSKATRRTHGRLASTTATLSRLPDIRSKLTIPRTSPYTMKALRRTYSPFLWTRFSI